MSNRCVILTLTSFLCLTPLTTVAQTVPTPPDTAFGDSPTPLPVELDDEFYDRLADQSCTELDNFAYREIPRFVLSDRPDLLYEFALYWENRCLSKEPVFRIILLGSIWDAGFNEGQYDEVVLEHLIDRYDPPSKPRNQEARQKYDDFTTSFADQLLPHVAHRSVEEFFCLFYAGKTEEAWSLLQSEDLEDTWLRFFYDQEMSELDRNNPIPILAATGGGWWPGGNVEFAGDKALVGMMSGVRWKRWLARFVFEVRVGRSSRPYWVDENGYLGRSDRFDAVLIGGEFGRMLFKRGRHGLDLFVGIGLDGVKPFKDEDLMLAAANVNVGLGYRFFLGKNRNWILGADTRHEWIGERNGNTDSMSGRAWSVRFSVGFVFNEGKARRLKGLGR